MSNTNTVYHVHRIELPMIRNWPMWAVRGALLLSIFSPALNDDYKQWLDPDPVIPVAGVSAPAVAAFAPLDVYTPYFYDGSPPNSYDFTLVDPVTDSEYVPVPSPCPATILYTKLSSAGYGNRLEFKCADTGHVWLMAHFDSIAVAEGQTIRKGESLGIQGSTGNSTGPHVHAEIDVDGIGGPGSTDPYSATEPTMLEAIEFWKSGVAPQPVAPAATAAGALLSDEQIKKAVGAAEGTVDWHTLEPDADYQGHSDPCVLNGTCPGRGTNKGYFSSDYGSTPEEANAYQLAKLKKFQDQAQAEAAAKFGAPLSQAALGNAIDLFNQSELAGSDFIKLLPTHDPTPQQIIDARAATYIDPATGRLNAPGLGNSWAAVLEDQARRTGAVQHGIKNTP